MSLASRKNEVVIGAGFVATALGVALGFLLDSVDRNLIDGVGLFTAVLVIGGLIVVMVGGVRFARREPLRRTFAFSFCVAAVAIFLMLILPDFNVHGPGIIVGIVLGLSVVIAAVIFVIALVAAPR